MHVLIRSSLAALCLCISSLASAADYVIDTEHQHAFVEFRIPHLGFSWMYGRFNDFSGTFSYDEGNPSTASVDVTVDTASIDTNNAERDKHLRSEDFLYVSEYPEAHFTSTSYEKTGEDAGILTGDLTLRGVTKEIKIDVTEMRADEDPWGGYRRGFIGTTTLELADYGIDYDLGPSGEEVEMTFSFEGVRQE